MSLFFLTHLTYCPLSAIALKLLRFLKLRKITPAAPPVHHSHKTNRTGCGVGMVGSSLRKLVSIPQLGSGGCDSLHLSTDVLCLVVSL